MWNLLVVCMCMCVCAILTNHHNRWDHMPKHLCLIAAVYSWTHSVSRHWADESALHTRQIDYENRRSRASAISCRTIVRWCMCAMMPPEYLCSIHTTLDTLIELTPPTATGNPVLTEIMCNCMSMSVDDEFMNIMWMCESGYCFWVFFFHFVCAFFTFC